MIDELVTLGFLVLLQAVLGFDNLLYISLESKRAPEDKQAYVRRIGIAGAVGLRIVLLFVLIKLIAYVQEPVFSIRSAGICEGTFNVQARKCSRARQRANRRPAGYRH